MSRRLRITVEIEVNGDLCSRHCEARRFFRDYYCCGLTGEELVEEGEGRETKRTKQCLESEP